MIHFDLPKDRSSIIKVVGVGGGGSNAVNHMFSEGIDGVNFIICNTDAQAITISKVPNKVQLGPNLTQGLGAGANPNVGKEATEESLDEIKRILEVNTKMVFITAGMGGGTGTGGAPIVAKICKDLGILTVGIVTTPFGYEGRKRMEQAKEGIELLKNTVDTLLVINNDKLRQQYGNLKMSEAFAKADNILATAAKCIVDVINVTGQINLDFADVCTVMRQGGVAILGNAAVAGEDRAQKAVEEALNSPLLNDNDIRGAKWILLNITSAEGENEATMDEIEAINEYVVAHAGQGVDIIMGQGYDNTLGDKIAITLIATGFEQKEDFSGTVLQAPKEEKIVMELQSAKPIATPTAIQPIATNNTAMPVVPTVATIQAQSATNPQTPQAQMPAQNNLPELKLVEPVATQPVVNVFSQNQPSANPQVATMQQPVAAPQQPAPAPVQHVILATSQPQNEVTPQINLQGFLEKPTMIYSENVNEKSTVSNESTAPVDKPLQSTDDNTLVWDFTSENKIAPLELVIKEEAPEPMENPVFMQQEHLMQNNNANAGVKNEGNFSLPPRNTEYDLDDDRTKKLRSLSFNYDNVDSNELEEVPAFMRRSTEINQTLAKVEKFYSNYSVNVDDNNQAQINVNSGNGFLEGQRPD